MDDTGTVPQPSGAESHPLILEKKSTQADDRRGQTAKGIVLTTLGSTHSRPLPSEPRITKDIALTGLKINRQQDLLPNMPPKRGNKMSLNDFLADESTGKTSWADDMDDLPIAPAPREDRYGAARRGGDFLANVPDRAERDRMVAKRGGPGGFRDERAPRTDIPLPDKPPYTAFLGCLSFDVTEGEIANFFAPYTAVSIRIVADRDRRPKGFGYIEFEELDGLKEALSRSGGNVAGRSIRVGLAEPPKSSDRVSFPPSAAEEASHWRRAGPLPLAADSGFGGAPRLCRERSVFGAPRDDRRSSFDSMDVSTRGRSGFGSRFQPSIAGRDGPGYARGPRDGPSTEQLGPSKGEYSSDWRTCKPVDSTARRRGAFGAGGDAAGASSSSCLSPFSCDTRPTSSTSDINEKYASREHVGLGSKFATTPPVSPAVSSRGSRASFERKINTIAATAGPSDRADSWRSARAAPTAGSPSSDARSPAAPVERKKLDLKPRSTVAPDAAAAAATGYASTAGVVASSKASPFGRAKPVDVQERERQIEERLQKERAQRAADDKAKQEKLKAEREKALKDAPRGPRADREKTGSTASPAPLAAESSEVTSTKGASPAALVSDAPKIKSPAPTGAWGGGRKASGALLGKAANANGSMADDAKMHEASEGVKKVSVNAE